MSFFFLLMISSSVRSSNRSAVCSALTSVGLAGYKCRLRRPRLSPCSVHRRCDLQNAPNEKVEVGEGPIDGAKARQERHNRDAQHADPADKVLHGKDRRWRRMAVPRETAGMPPRSVHRAAPHLSGHSADAPCLALVMGKASPRSQNPYR